MAKVLFTNNDIGGTYPWILVLKRLQEAGHEVITAAAESAPSLVVLREAGFQPIVLDDVSDWKDTDAFYEMNKILCREKPDCCLVGISATDAGSEKSLVWIAFMYDIPVIALVESWPHGWLEAYGDRDIEIYKDVLRFCVPDAHSFDRMIAAGFNRDQVVVTGNPSDDMLMASLSRREEYRLEVRKHFGITSDAIVITWMTGAELDNPDEDHPNAREWYGAREADLLQYFLSSAEIAKKNVGTKRFEVIVRVEPNIYSDTVRRRIANHCPSAHFDNVGHGGVPKPHFAADIVIGVKTPILDKAAMLGVPAFSYIPNLPSSEVEPFANKIGIVTPLRDQADFARLMRNMTFFPEQTLALIKGAQKITTPILDATRNVESEVEKLLH